MKHLIIFITIVFLTGCTSIKVKPISIEPKVETICVQFNTDVKQKTFLPTLKREFGYYGIKLREFHIIQKAFVTEYPEEVKKQCGYILTYVANWTWDIGYFCWRIKLNLYDNSMNEVANALFEKTCGKGGLDPSKFDSTESKVRELLKQFMVNYFYVIEPPQFTSSEPTTKGGE